MIAAGQVDLGIAVGRVTASEARLRTIGTGRLAALIPEGHELARGPVGLDALVRAGLIGLTPRGPLGRVLNEALAAQGLSLPDTLTVNALAAVAPLALALGRPAVVDEFTARKISALGLATVPLEPSVPFDIFALMPAKPRNETAASVFAEAIALDLKSTRNGPSAAAG